MKSFLIEDILKEHFGRHFLYECCPPPKKSRRNRTVFTETQLMGLEKRFDSQKYLSVILRLIVISVNGFVFRRPTERSWRALWV